MEERVAVAGLRSNAGGALICAREGFLDGRSFAYGFVVFRAQRRYYPGEARAAGLACPGAGLSGEVHMVYSLFDG